MAQIERISVFKYKDKFYESFYEAEIARNEDIDNRLYKMYNSSGELTYDFDCATFVYLQTRQSASQFIKDCIDEDVIYTGIEEGDIGLFLWNEHTMEYMHFNTNLYEGMQKILTQLLNN